MTNTKTFDFMLPDEKPVVNIKEELVQTSRGSFKRITSEFWTERQRQMHPLHYIVSYRASFKPELPAFFIEKYTKPGDVVLDPFSGRGTTALQANLMGRSALCADVNPMSERLCFPKCNPVSISAIEARLKSIDFKPDVPVHGEEDFAMFYEPRTYRELMSLKRHLESNREDVDRFIELTALSRLHGHSTGFFSVYSFPQISVSPENQRKINEKRNQTAEYRPISPRIVRKAERSLGSEADIRQIRKQSANNCYETCDARRLNYPGACTDLIVTSPPFLNKADYILDNWLELWFLSIPIEPLRDKIVQTSSLSAWIAFMSDVIKEMERVLRPGGVAVIEVGEVEVKKQVLHLDEVIVSIVEELQKQGSRLEVEEVMIHLQSFTKLANCFKIDNNSKGTNTHRLIVLRKG